MTDDEIKEIKIRYNIADHEKYEGKKYRDTARYFMDLYTAERKVTERVKALINSREWNLIWAYEEAAEKDWKELLKWAREGNDDKQKLKVKLNMTGQEEPRIHYPEDNDDKTHD